MVLKEHKTMQAPVLVGSVQSLISFVMYRRGFHAGLCSLGCSSFYLLPPLRAPLSCWKMKCSEQIIQRDKILLSVFEQKKTEPPILVWNVICLFAPPPVGAHGAGGGRGQNDSLLGCLLSTLRDCFWAAMKEIREWTDKWNFPSALSKEDVLHAHQWVLKKTRAVTTQKGNYWL